MVSTMPPSCAGEAKDVPVEGMTFVSPGSITGSRDRLPNPACRTADEERTLDAVNL